jgi:hypothetical protein
MLSLRRAAQLLAGASRSAGVQPLRMAGSLPKKLGQNEPVITEGRQAFEGDLRSTSGLGLGDGISNHTGKWLQVGANVCRAQRHLSRPSGCLRP